MEYALTARVGKNADVMVDIARLCIPPGSAVLDATYGKGLFWSKVNTDQWRLITNDIDPERGQCHNDFRKLPDVWQGLFDAVVLDPPYLYVGGFKTLTHAYDGIYKNKERANDDGIYGVKAVDQMYFDGIKEAVRVLRPGGVLILKCMDQIMSGKQNWSHNTYMQYAESIGLYNLDMFVLVSKGAMQRHPPEKQKHARRNHSFFLVMRKAK